MAATFLFGKDAVAYYSSTALDASITAATASWTEYDNVRDVTGDFTATKVDVSTRATMKLGWETEAVVANKGQIKVNIPQKVAEDTTLTALINAWKNKTTVAMLFMNQARTVSKAMGLAANFSVEMTQGQPLKEVQTWDVTLSAESYPEFYIVP
jgi:hypothetical protein